MVDQSAVKIETSCLFLLHKNISAMVKCKLQDRANKLHY